MKEPIFTPALLSICLLTSLSASRADDLPCPSFSYHLEGRQSLWAGKKDLVKTDADRDSFGGQSFDDSLSLSNEFKRFMAPDGFCCYLFGIFFYICDSCPSGKLLKDLQVINDICGENIKIAVFLPSFYSLHDIENLKSQFHLSYDIHNTADDFASTWTARIPFHERRQSGLMMILERSGQIKKIIDYRRDLLSQVIDDLDCQHLGIKKGSKSR